MGCEQPWSPRWILAERGFAGAPDNGASSTAADSDRDDGPHTGAYQCKVDAVCREATDPYLSAAPVGPYCP
ncbi:hypothetical protein, partial [Kribbella albertanoniae]|uniref:hypothetical protein n=1 Tax=Kribbella albertanoniae TaxID=1266829 RepID=UPI001EDEF074